MGVNAVISGCLVVREGQVSGYLPAVGYMAWFHSKLPQTLRSGGTRDDYLFATYTSFGLGSKRMVVESDTSWSKPSDSIYDDPVLMFVTH